MIEEIREGVPVWSLSGTIEGRTTGSNRPCPASDCPGYLIGVRWQTDQLMFICSEGWEYDKTKNTVKVTAGGEISARFVSPKPLGTLPLDKSLWPTAGQLSRRKGWRKI